MDIRLTLHQPPSTDPSIVALFTFVARDPNTQKATAVNPLVPQTSEQRRRFEERSEIAKALKAARKAAAAQGGHGGHNGVKGHASQQSSRREWANELLAEARRMSRMPGVHASCPQTCYVITRMEVSICVVLHGLRGWLPLVILC